MAGRPRKEYTPRDYERDKGFIAAVRASPAFDYLGQHNDTDGHIIERKMTLVLTVQKNLYVEGGRPMPVEDCKPSRVSRVLFDKYSLAVKRVAQYLAEHPENQPSIDGRLDHRMGTDSEARPAQPPATLGQHMAALDGYWGQIASREGPSTMKRMLEEEIRFYDSRQLVLNLGDVKEVR